MTSPINLIKHPTRILICGKSNCGKTTIAIKILSHLLCYNPNAKLIIICDSWFIQPVFQVIRRLNITDIVYPKVTDEILTKIIIEQQKERKKLILFIDDEGANPVLHRNNKGSFADLANRARHLNISTIVISQILTSIDTSYRLNADNIIMFKSLRLIDKEALKNEFNPWNDDTIKQIYVYYTQPSYHFIFIHIGKGTTTRVFVNFTHEIIKQ